MKRDLELYEILVNWRTDEFRGGRKQVERLMQQNNGFHERDNIWIAKDKYNVHIFKVWYGPETSMFPQSENNEIGHIEYCFTFPVESFKSALTLLNFEKQESEVERLREPTSLELALKQLRGAKSEIKKLQAFKDYVHKRLDDAGIEKDPESPHKEAGCRIGGRLDLVLSQLPKEEGWSNDKKVHLGEPFEVAGTGRNFVATTDNRGNNLEISEI